MAKGVLPLVVSWFLEPRCNYDCKFCFATFEDIPGAEVVRDPDTLLLVRHSFPPFEPLYLPFDYEVMTHIHIPRDASKVITDLKNMLLVRTPPKSPLPQPPFQVNGHPKIQGCQGSQHPVAG